MAAMLVRFRNLFRWLTGVFRSRADLILIGESGVATAIAGLACPTAASSARLPRSAVLGNAATTVVRLAETLSRGDTRDGCPLASHRLSMVLGLALAGSAPSRPQSGEPGGTRLALADGGREPDLGRTPHSRRVAHVGLRYLRAQRIPMDETCSPEPRSCETMARLSPQPPRSYRRHGFLHNTDPDLQHSVLFLRDQPRAAANPALQRDSQSQRAMGDAAAPRNMGIRRAAAAFPALRPGFEVRRSE